MEKRTVVGLVLGIKTDRIFKFSYITLLTEEKLETVKLPSYFAEYKHQHLLKPSNLLTVELVKTKKNWILTSVLKYFSICHLSCFGDYLKISEIQSKILEYLRENEPTDALKFVTDYLQNKEIEKINLLEFDKKLSSHLGFC